MLSQDSRSFAFLSYVVRFYKDVMIHSQYGDVGGWEHVNAATGKIGQYMHNNRKHDSWPQTDTAVYIKQLFGDSF